MLAEAKPRCSLLRKVPQVAGWIRSTLIGTSNEGPSESSQPEAGQLRRGAGAGTRFRRRRVELHGRVPLDRIIDLTAMDGDLLGGLHAQSHLVAADFHDDN